MPGVLYVTATFIFFILATVSICLDLTARSIDSELVEVVDIETALFYIFFLSGVLSDAMMIHRCYRLWNSRKSVIILPLLGLIAICVFCIVSAVLWSKSSFGAVVGPFLVANLTASQNAHIYGIATLVENIILMGLMAGRIWWLEHRMMNILISGKNKRKVSQSLLGPILQSGILNPIFLSIWVGGAYSSTLNQILTPCALTQIFGISSTLIVLSIGIGLASDSRMSMVTDEEKQSQLVSKNLEESEKFEMMQEVVRTSTDTAQPGELIYDPLLKPKRRLSMVEHADRDDQDTVLEL